ncbi:MAG: hypothetical protein OH326_01940 [Candidatus Parvarchaeota archaeon]|nr:hypothetical protein [Candidatus Haiyanarchaeum thermophilum]
MEVTVFLAVREDKGNEMIERLLKSGLASFAYLIHNVRAFHRGREEEGRSIMIFETDWILLGKCLTEVKKISKEVNILAILETRSIRFLRDTFGMR